MLCASPKYDEKNINCEYENKIVIFGGGVFIFGSRYAPWRGPDLGRPGDGRSQRDDDGVVPVYAVDSLCAREVNLYAIGFFREIKDAGIARSVSELLDQSAKTIVVRFFVTSQEYLFLQFARLHPNQLDHSRE